MGDGYWSRTTNSRFGTEVWYCGVPGQGCWYWTPKCGNVWVGGVYYQIYASQDWERGGLGAPLKWYGGEGRTSEFDQSGWVSYGMWFEGGAIASAPPYGARVRRLGWWGQGC